MKNIIEDYKISRKWKSVSKGNWSFLSCAMYSYYTSDLLVLGEKFSKHSIQLCSGEESETWFVSSELDDFGKRILHINNEEQVENLLSNIKISGDKVLEIIKSTNIETMDFDYFRKLWFFNKEYHQYHLTVKYLGEYLEKDKLEIFGGRLTKARQEYGEKTQGGLEDLTQSWLKYLSKKINIDFQLLKYITPQELQNFFESAELPNVNFLKDRRNNSMILGTSTGYIVITGKDVEDIKKILYNFDNSQQTLRGSSGYPGIVKGIARIIKDPEKLGNFSDGDILVTGMTHVNYIPIVKRSSALVTDTGGVLSHAAIIARELKKPCVIGTENATKTIVDGQTIYVDGDNGIVKLL